MAREHTRLLTTVGALIALSCVVTACGDGGGGQAAAPATDDSQEPITIQVDHLPPEYPATFNRFFPSQVRVRPGQVVEFRASFTGEPHDVALGTVVDEAVAAFRAVPEEYQGSILPGYPVAGVSQEQQAAIGRLPQPRTPDMVDDIDDTTITVVPCYLEEGVPPVDEPCPPEHRHIPDTPFDGTQSYFASPGLIETHEAFRVELADDIAPGDYAFVCTLHASWMNGTITVVDADEPADTPAQVRATAEEEIAAAVAEHQPVAEEIASSTGPQVMAGELGSDMPPPEVTINVFPERIKAAVGETITWSLRGAHTLTFNAPRELLFVFERDDDWRLRSNKEGNEPTEGQPRQAQFPAFDRSQPPPPPPPPGMVPPATLDGGTWDGEGLLNTGLLYSFYGQGIDYTLTFSEPGTYSYVCIRHPGMVGVVEVE